MYIRKLELKGYKRFSLSEITLLEYKPEKTIQLILATNGAGKSSLVRECSPLPSNLKKEFAEDGYKYIAIEHNGKEYIISSGYIAKNKHSFSIDNVEYNSSGLQKIQLQLVEEHFGLTPAIHEILLGNNLFTNMSIAEKKHWLTKISHIDYSYPFTIYNKIKQKHRDIIGGVKVTNTKLLQTDTKLLTTEQKDKLTEDLKVLSTLTNFFLESKDNTIYTNLDDTALLDTTMKEISYTLNRTITDSFTKYEDINNEISINTHILSEVDKDIDRIKKDLDKIDKQPIEDISDINYSVLIKEKNLYIKQQDELIAINNNSYKLDLDSIESIYNAYSYIYGDLITNLGSLSAINELYYSKQTLVDTDNSIDIYSNNLISLNKKITIIENNIKHIEEHEQDDKILCKQCGNSWHAIYDKKLLLTLQQDLITNNSSREKCKATLTTLTKNKGILVEKSSYIHNIHKLTTIHTDIKSILQVIFQEYDLQTDTSLLINKVDDFNMEIAKLKEYATITAKLQETKHKLALIENSNNAQQEFLKAEKNKLEDSLSSHIYKKDLASKLKIRLIDQKKIYESLKEKYELLKSILLRSSNIYKYNLNKLRNSTLNNLISEYKSIIVDIEQRLYDSSLVEEKLKYIKDELNNLAKREKALRLLEKNLSPTEGLIAKSINSFLDVFVQEMNHIINTIWSYDLRLLPCSSSDGNDLDYKFPISIDNKVSEDDIKKGSTSMKEIIDLAFKIVFMKYLGLTNMPLILDEFGRTMDPVHRVNAYNIVEQSLSNSFQQIFIISHFETMYGQLSNKSDISILNSDNLMLDEKLNYNKVMTIKRK